MTPTMSRSSTRRSQRSVPGRQHLPFFHRTPDLRALVLAQDVVFVGGGNTKSMLAVWRDWGLPEILKEASASGIVLGGRQRRRHLLVRAGCYRFLGRSTAAARLHGMAARELLPALRRRSRAQAGVSLVDAGRADSSPGYAIEDGVAAHFRNGRLACIVSKKAGSTAYYVSVDAGRITEEALRQSRSLISRACT